MCASPLVFVRRTSIVSFSRRSMRATLKLRYFRRNQVITLLAFLFCCVYYFCLNDDGSLHREADLNITRRYIESMLQEALKLDKGTGCEFPNLDPFAKEATQFDEEPPKIHCEGRDWVRCYLSECRVDKEILKTTQNIKCTYRDIIYENDSKYTIGSPTSVTDDGVYILRKSDHVKVKCTGKHMKDVLPSKWTGHVVGFREQVERIEPPPGREESIDVLTFGFDSTSRNGFIRRMPKSYEYLTKELGATILKGYNIVGDGTPAALFPILTGRTELELPDVRKISTYKGSLDDMPFIFYKLKEDGYRTAFFEDTPAIGTFQYRFKGFKRQPADHYLRAFHLEELVSRAQKYCVGDTLNYKMMMNITEQFFKLEGKHFAFTFIVDISHDDFNMIAISDDDTRSFLKSFKDSGRLDNTLLIVMGDHGPRYAKVRDTLQGKFEERMPLMAIHLPEVLVRRRPDVAAIFETNSQILTTPHDIHATILDAMGMRKYMNNYKLEGADLTRGLSLFEPIPKNRSCSEAGIEAHWCVCVAWDNIIVTDAIYQRVAEAFVTFINELTQTVRSKCVPRTLLSISWVMRRKTNSQMLSFKGNLDVDGYVGKFNSNYKITKDYYQIKVTVGPGFGIYEASAVHLKDEDRFIFNTREISRTNAYNNEPKCISATNPHLNMYCYFTDPDLYFLTLKYDNVSCYHESGGELQFANGPFRPPDQTIFFHETSCRGGLNSRQACAVEAAARAHTHFTVFVLFLAPVRTFNTKSFGALKHFSRVKFARVNIHEYAKNTPLEPLVASGKLNRTKWRICHTSDAMRYLTLYKWGGIYLDLDTMVVKPLDVLSKNWSARETDFSVAAGAMAFSKDPVGRMFAEAAISNLAKKFRGDTWGNNGPEVITRVLLEKCGTSNFTAMSAGICHGFEVYKPELFYPIGWQDALQYMKPGVISEKPYAHHMWNHITQDYIIANNSLYAELARKFCPNVFYTYADNFGN